MRQTEHSDVLHLRGGGTSVVLATALADLPVVVWWGEDLGDRPGPELADLATAAVPQRVSGNLDVPVPMSIVPGQAAGWFGTPGLSGHRAGRGFSPRLVTRAVRPERLVADDGGPARVVVRAADDETGLALDAELEVSAAGLFRQRLTLTNLGSGPYTVDALAPVFPLPAGADELLDTTGRHLRERSPQRHAFTVGAHLREGRRGRPGLDASLLLAAGRPGFGFERGLVHAVHAAWSGNYRLLAERTSTGDSYLAAGELLLPGEIVLAEGDAYATPWAIGSWGDGLDALARRFHEELRARPHHPRRARPVTLNTWEAVYFDHSLPKLLELAERAAAVGVERFVLDDGWFRGRRDDTAGLGDWFVDTDVWPDGLDPIITAVRGHGMEFGLWVEPEMVNLDSDLAREHPDWILRARADLPLPGRQQYVLDLAHPEAYKYVLSRLDALLAEYDIAYLKWDHNRDLLEAGDAATGGARVHENVLAVYRLLAEVKDRHPGLEIESCSSGGGRVDLGILELTDRVWASDTLDPVERLTIQRYTGLVLPPELMGMHLTTPAVHSTGRTVALDLSAGVALTGHFGIEWDLTTLDDAGLREVADWVALHRRFRELAHSGVVVNADTGPHADVRGVVAADGSAAVFTYAQVATSVTYPPGRFTLPGLDPARRYTVRVVAGSVDDGPGQSPLGWARQPVTLTGRELGRVGLQAPVLFPERLVVLELTAA